MFLGSGFAQIFEEIVSIGVKTLSSTNVAASRPVKGENALLPVAVRRSKTAFGSSHNLSSLHCLLWRLSVKPRYTGRPHNLSVKPLITEVLNRSSVGLVSWHKISPLSVQTSQYKGRRIRLLVLLSKRPRASSPRKSKSYTISSGRNSPVSTVRASSGYA